MARFTTQNFLFANFNERTSFFSCGGNFRVYVENKKVLSVLSKCFFFKHFLLCCTKRNPSCQSHSAVGSENIRFSVSIVLRHLCLLLLKTCLSISCFDVKSVFLFGFWHPKCEADKDSLNWLDCWLSVEGNGKNYGEREKTQKCVVVLQSW